MKRYDQDIALPKPGQVPAKAPGPLQTLVTVELEVTEIRGRGFSSPMDEARLRAQGLVTCFVKNSPTRPLIVFVNGVTYELPEQQWISVPVSVFDVLTNANLL